MRKKIRVVEDLESGEHDEAPDLERVTVKTDAKPLPSVSLILVNNGSHFEVEATSENVQECAAIVFSLADRYAEKRKNESQRSEVG